MGEQEAIDNEFEPIVWCEIDGIRLQDLSPSKIQEALTLVKVCPAKLNLTLMNGFQTISIPQNPLWKSLNIQSDETVIDEYCGRLLQVMKDCCSIAAICVETGRLVAVAICKIMSLDEYDWTLWKIMPNSSKELDKILTIQYDIIKYSDLSKGNCFHVFDLIIADELREQFSDKSFEVILLKQAYKTAHTLKCSYLSYTCFRKIESENANNSCMHLRKEIHYSLYMDSFGNKIFKNVEKEYTAFLFTRLISNTNKSDK